MCRVAVSACASPGSEVPFDQEDLTSGRHARVGRERLGGAAAGRARAACGRRRALTAQCGWVRAGHGASWWRGVMSAELVSRGTRPGTTRRVISAARRALPRARPPRPARPTALPLPPAARHPTPALPHATALQYLSTSYKCYCLLMQKLNNRATFIKEIQVGEIDWARRISF